MNVWKRTSDEKPPEGLLCMTISPNGMEARLRYSSGLWFTENESMYVYYTPELWRPV